MEYFSIVMPVYQAEKYLNKSIDSIMAQTFPGWELILVEDGSSDGSLEICQEYSRKDSRIRLFTQDGNQGASAARSRGVEEARGRYLTFMDADDYIDDTVLEDIYSVLERNPAKLTVMGVLEEYYDSDGKVTSLKAICPIPDPEHSNVYASAREDGEGMRVEFLKTREEARKTVITLEQRTLYGYLWNKFYDREYLKSLNLSFEDMPLLEDASFNLSYMEEVDSLNLVDLCGYHYCKRKQASQTSGFFREYYEIHRDHVEKLLQQQIRWGLADDKTRSILAAIYARYICSALERNCDKQSNMSHKGRKMWAKRLFKDSLYEELVPYGDPANGLIGAVIGALNAKSAFALLATGRIAYIVKNKMPGVFAKLRRKA